MPQRETTLTEFIIGEQRKAPGATGGFTALLNDIRLACKRIAYLVGKGALAGVHGGAGSRNVQGEEQQKLDVLANQIFLTTNEWGGHLAGMVSEELEGPYRIPAEYPRGRYLLAFDPLDGSSNIDVNVSVGSIFSVLACPAGASAARASRASAAWWTSCPRCWSCWRWRARRRWPGARGCRPCSRAARRARPWSPSG